MWKNQAASRAYLGMLSAELHPITIKTLQRGSPAPNEITIQSGRNAPQAYFRVPCVSMHLHWYHKGHGLESIEGQERLFTGTTATVHTVFQLSVTLKRNENQLEIAGRPR